ncbi:hypothetical protein [Methanoculleus chikugoensis]|uniref:hypothetical protein n=1 Tax=Methanoculleus chikugoensis TaxID=118126 RepID=UPI000A605B42|nr:hypothetical protein [Methanoculleus chikugoensis]
MSTCLGKTPRPGGDFGSLRADIEKIDLPFIVVLLAGIGTAFLLMSGGDPYPPHRPHGSDLLLLPRPDHCFCGRDIL